MQTTLEEILAVPVDERDEAWELSLLRLLPKASARVLSPEPTQGPDHMPYLMVAAGDGQPSDDNMMNILGWLSTRGIGLVLNPQKPMPDYVMSYGMVWNFRERGEILTQNGRMPTGSFEIAAGQEVLTGNPSESYLPKYARSLIKQFLMDQGMLAPKILMASFDKGENYDLCFSVESLKSPPVEEHNAIAEALAWFLPAHYSVSLVTEKVLPGFQPV